MFRAVAMIASVAGASAFVPSGLTKTSTSLRMSFASEPGAWGGDPVGVVSGIYGPGKEGTSVKGGPTYWDPVGLAKTPELFAQYREAELKHGRVAQLAVIGYIVPEIYKFPGEIAPGITFESIPNGVAAIEAVPALGWIQMFFLVGAVDYRGLFVYGNKEAKGLTDEEFKLEQTKELNNGRLAMVAILELLRHDSQMVVGGMYSGDHLITGLPFLY